ncbi:follitropin subunit beta [Stegostoma tigrinum]|uniref:follitropin subunit beta n=1 Tax=Stegostoma tigrinum TaxID=3053191 RepID=UPI00202B85DC|nr:follitropin subunit beta [Stegostoma tigrinum]XP_059508142.1 follitropin subunit beta [Stegostoma tigrinum]XP_059508143.1 follitropin subunit beta [Stegostoma tigrinum]XP_059508144.1 follitropin subunit beta [Stegostoma tigrinum]XP_059508145.1 follitropin subunit beta [Stegostoma tigrinum]XP_059508146.1 follitropin subunit beta [Stegostoma tigrinum]
MLQIMVTRIFVTYIFLILLSWMSVQSLNRCQLTNITISVEKEECGYCGMVNATWCAGYCFTKDPVSKNSLATIYQDICSYKEIVYETITIPNCPANVDPYYTYAIATGCQCGMCNTETTDCTVSALEPTHCSLTP